MTEVEELWPIARAEGPRGEVVLRRRIADGRAVDELIVNGTFAMDSVEVSTELALARTVARAGVNVLVGGLGLGFTVAELLRQDVARIDVVELEACLVDWARKGLTDTLATVAADSRVHLHVGDVADVLFGSIAATDLPSTRWDGIVLDVDNGPDFLIHQANARIYRLDLLRAAAERLTPAGTLAVWCQGPAPTLAETLCRLGGQVEGQLMEVIRDGRWLAYAIYTLTR